MTSQNDIIDIILLKSYFFIYILKLNTIKSIRANHSRNKVSLPNSRLCKIFSTREITCYSFFPFFNSINNLDVDECANDVCKNEAKCKNTHGSYICICKNGWEGDTCERGKIFNILFSLCN